MARRKVLIALLVFLVAGQALTAQRGGRAGAGEQGAPAAQAAAPEVPIVGLAGIAFRVSDSPRRAATSGAFGSRIVRPRIRAGASPRSLQDQRDQYG